MQLPSPRCCAAQGHGGPSTAPVLQRVRPPWPRKCPGAHASGYASFKRCRRQLRLWAFHQEAAGAGEGVGSRLVFSARQATESAEFRAAGYLRAASFYHIPEDRSEFAKRAHLRMKGDYAWDTLELQVKGQDRIYRHVKVVPFVATAPYVEGDPEAEAIRAAMPDASCMLPAIAGRPAEVVVGTLDLNQGARLPAEELAGRLPAEGDRAALRAYLSNVCVAAAARRRGIAKMLIQAAAEEATRRGVRHLYVHVVADNAAARQLYTQQCGFEVEQEETEGYARALNRPRRLLLGRPLP